VKKWRHEVVDFLGDELPGRWRLSEWRKNGRDAGTKQHRWTCFWLRHGWRSVVAGHVYVNDPRHHQVRYTAYSPLGKVLESTDSQGTCIRDGGSIGLAKAEVDHILMNVTTHDLT